MATVNEQICREIIAGDGWYPGDHLRVVRVVSYDNAFDGGRSWAIEYPHEKGRYQASPFIRNPKVVWEAT